MSIDLLKYDNSWYSPGRGFLVRGLWFIVNACVLRNGLNASSFLKVLALRMFGARIGSAVVIKPGVNVKYPWNLEISDRVWIGENVWLDSLAPIRIGRNVCVSQGAYLCTGNHNWSSPGFDLIVKPIAIKDGAWVAAHALVGPGVTIGEGAVLEPEVSRPRISRHGRSTLACLPQRYAAGSLVRTEGGVGRDSSEAEECVTPERPLLWNRNRSPGAASTAVRRDRGTSPSTKCSSGNERIA